MSSRPPEMTPDEIEKRIQDCLPDFRNFSRIVEGRSPVKYDFVDREWFGKPGITLERYTDEKIAALGRVYIPMLSSGFSIEEGTAAIFILAYHLKAPGSRFRAFIFNSDESLQATTDHRYNYNSDKLNATSGIAATSDPTREAAVYSYVAASLFRLFTKPASHYVKTWTQVLNGFSKFYAEPMRVTLPVPNVAAIQNLKFVFSLNHIEKGKVTLYRFLYMSNSDESHKGLKTFLYDNVLENTGMHILSIMEQLSDVLNCSLSSIIITLEQRKTNAQMKSLLYVLKMMTSNDDKYKRNMWRYGRLFDEAFLCDLQTKICVDVVYVLAEALRSESPENTVGLCRLLNLQTLARRIKGNMLNQLKGF